MSGVAGPVAGQAWPAGLAPHRAAHGDAGRPTIRQRGLPLSLPVMRQMVMSCDFEGDVEVVLGVAARQPFRVMDFQNPSRIVVDVKQP